MAQMNADFDKRDPETYAIIGAAMTVHNALGCGFLEAVYQEALERELSFLGIPHERESALPVFYRGERLSTSYRVDFICFNRVVVELKTIKCLTGDRRGPSHQLSESSQHAQGSSDQFWCVPPGTQETGPELSLGIETPRISIARSLNLSCVGFIFHLSSFIFHLSSATICAICG